MMVPMCEPDVWAHSNEHNLTYVAAAFQQRTHMYTYIHAQISSLGISKDFRPWF